MIHREAHGLLNLGVAVDLYVSSRPEVIEERSLLGDQSFPARRASREERRGDLVPQGGLRSRVRPPVRDELDDPESLTRLEFIDRNDPRGVVMMFSTSQLISLVLAPLALVMLVVLSRRLEPAPRAARKAT